MKTLLSILFLFFATYGYSQSEKLFTVDRELSNSNINQIYQAKDGVIWIATDDGLNRYDGAKFSIYKHKEGNDSSLVDNNVRPSPVDMVKRDTPLHKLFFRDQ